MKTFYKILCACLACLCVVTYASRADRVAELETERDIYQSRRRRNTMTELKPCRKCGGTPKVRYKMPFSWVECKCGAKTSRFVDGYEQMDGMEDVIAAWNRRANDEK